MQPPLRARPMFCLAIVFMVSLANAPMQAQDATDPPSKSGVLIEATAPISADQTNQILAALARTGEIADAASAGRGRKTVVLRLQSDPEAGGTTAFEDALRISRRMSDSSLRKVKVVVWVDGEIADDSALLVVAADQILVSSSATVTSVDHSGDELIRLNYQSLAKRRGIIPPPVALAWADPSVELALVTGNDGTRELVAGDDLQKQRQSGDVAREEIWASPAEPLRIDADRFRQSQLAAAVVDSVDEAAAWLDLAELESMDSASALANPVGVRLDITGSIAPNRVRRWLSNLSAADASSSGKEINLYFATFDSSGGNVASSASLAATLIDPQPPIVRSVGVITGTTLGDSTLPALACDPLFMTAGATLGGGGNATVSEEQLNNHEELLDLIADRTGRSLGLLRGVLASSGDVFRYTNRRSGRVLYATDRMIADDDQWNRDDWNKGDRVELADGLSATQALELGLIDGIVDSPAAAAAKVGLAETPPIAGDRSLVRIVEEWGNKPFLGFLLLMIGFSALSAEMNAPGLGFPGFIALVCFGLFFWIKFLAGTAEWFELMALALGLVCIGIELFVVPGVGIFGIGGLALTVLGIVLMSQTFVLPQNDYQLGVLSRSVWTALGGLLTLVVAFVGFRLSLPHVPLFRSLVMESRRGDVLDRTERLGDYEHLMGHTGTATTPLRPSGKASFGSDVIQVVSDGSMIEKGRPVRVVEVHATRVIVEPVETA